jgi:hypothetical protein
LLLLGLQLGRQLGQLTGQLLVKLLKLLKYLKRHVFLKLEFQCAALARARVVTGAKGGPLLPPQEIPRISLAPREKTPAVRRLQANSA